MGMRKTNRKFLIKVIILMYRRNFTVKYFFAAVLDPSAMMSDTL